MPEDEIRKYLHGLMIDSWLTMYAIDFNIYNKQPLVQVYEKDKISLISESLELKMLKIPVIYLRSHTYATYDDWFQYGQTTM